MDSDFRRKRIHSLTGVIPVGLFLVYHLYIQLYLHQGAEVYNAKVADAFASPLSEIFLVLFIYLPLIFHSVYGVKLVAETTVQPNYTYFQHILYWLQRLSGIGVFLFIGAHLYQAKIKPILSGTHDAYLHLAEGFADADSAMITKTVYILGVTGATFHLCNGINTFCMTWGITLTPKAQARTRSISIVAFVFLTAIAFYALKAIW